MFDSWPQEKGKVEERRLGGEDSIAQAGSGNIQLFIFYWFVWFVPYLNLVWGVLAMWLVTALPLTMRHESATICFIPIERMAIHLQKSRRVSHWTTCSIQIIPTVQLTIPSCTYCHSSKWLHDPYLGFFFALPCQSHGQEIAKLCLQLGECDRVSR